MPGRVWAEMFNLTGSFEDRLAERLLARAREIESPVTFAKVYAATLVRLDVRARAPGRSK